MTVPLLFAVLMCLDCHAAVNSREPSQVAVSLQEEGPFDGRLWFLNGEGTNETYTVTAFGSGGERIPEAQQLLVGRHTAWPSAIDDGRSLKVYASVFDGTRWSQVGLWESTSFDPTQMDFVGEVKAALPDEPYGIGPVHVGYDPDQPHARARYLMWYLVRGAFGPGYTTRLAVSPDGLTWTSDREVLWATLPEEEAGFSGPSHACRLPTGQWVLFYHAYPSLTQSVAVVALSASNSPAGPFREKHVIMTPDDIATTVVGDALPGTTSFTVRDHDLVSPGLAYMLSDGSPETLELVTVTSTQEGTITVALPLTHDHSNHALLSLLQKKVAPGFAWMTPQGAWGGVFTGYGHMVHSEPLQVASEYTVLVKSPSLLGPWEVDTSRPAPVFQPFSPDFLYSTENPTPVLSNANCDMQGGATP